MVDCEQQCLDIMIWHHQLAIGIHIKKQESKTDNHFNIACVVQNYPLQHASGKLPCLANHIGDFELQRYLYHGVWY